MHEGNEMQTNDELVIFNGHGYESNPQEPLLGAQKCGLQTQKISARISHNNQENHAQARSTMHASKNLGIMNFHSISHHQSMHLRSKTSYRIPDFLIFVSPLSSSS
jgi:hypothetical protein